MSVARMHTRAGTKVLAVFVALLGLAAAACSAQLDDAVAAHRAGKYAEAIAIYRRALGADANSLAARKGLTRALTDTGEYAEAEQTLRGAPAAQEAAVAVALGDVLVLQGKIADAEAAYRRGLRSQDSLSARVNLAVMQYRKGEKAAALDEFDRFIDVYNGAKTRLRAEDLAAVGVAVRYLGVRDPQLFKDALLAYEQAVETDPNNDDFRVRIGELFLEKYQADEAEKSFQEVLRKNPKNPRALIGLARSKEFDGSAEAIDLAKQALEVNPNLLEAQLLMGRNSLGVEDAATARAAIDKALQVNPSSIEAFTLLAATQYFAGEKSQYDASVVRIQAMNPRYSDLYSTLADISVQTRRYTQAVELARQAIALDSTDWKAHGILGINLMRLGSVKEGRASLEVAFKGDPYNVWFKNTLDLLDTMGKFRETELGRFQIALSARESELLTPYVAELAEDAYQKLSARYRTQLTGPIRIELFNNHGDFSVRTVGLAGIGALGASFGNVLVMDSPSAREAGHFNWGTTLWHELAHAFHLAMSDHRVPRWLTEGLAVLEERKARPGWGDDLGPSYLIAYKSKKLLPVSEMNRGFVRPAYPEQVMHSYFQASLVSQMIEEQYGFDAILNLLKAYKNGMSTEQAFPSVLKTDMKAFDKKYETWFEQKFARQTAAVRVPNRGPSVGRSR
jgi:tetratricopeptide (TPR) repeat protein